MKTNYYTILILIILLYPSTKLGAQDSTSVGNGKNLVFENISKLSLKIKEYQKESICYTCYSNGESKLYEISNSYLNNLAVIASVVDNSEDENEILKIRDYLDKASYNLNISKDRKLYDSVIENLNTDLIYKISKSIRENTVDFSLMFKEIINVDINAIINSEKIPQDKFRLYYSKLVYDDYIYNTDSKLNQFIKSSDNLTTPFKIRIEYTPKVIFWLKDVTTNEIYLPDSMKELSKNPSNFTISFKKYKK